MVFQCRLAVTADDRVARKCSAQALEARVEAAGQGEYSIKEFPADRKKIDIGDYYSADKAFRDATGWKHETSLNNALKQTVDYYRSRMEAYQ